MKLEGIPVTEKRYLGIDPSLTSTGWAIIANGELDTGRIRFPKLTGAERLWNFSRVFNLTFDNQRFDGIAIEGYSYGSRGTVYEIGELGGVLRLTLFNHGKDYLVVPPTTLKQFTTGKGNAEKQAVAKELFRRYGVDCVGNDETDAAGLALFAMAQDFPDLCQTDAQRKSLDKGEKVLHPVQSPLTKELHPLIRTRSRPQ